MAKKKIRRVQEKLRFDKCACVEANGRSGGLAIFWMEDICAFCDCLYHNGLREVESYGHPFTWCNNRMNGFIEEKLDRVVVNSVWCSLFPNASVENLVWDGLITYLSCYILQV